MTGMNVAWQRATNSNGVLGFIDILLRGAGQVLFQNNPVTGLFIIVAVFVGAIQADLPSVGIGGVVGLLVGTVTAMLLSVDRTSLRQGMFGFSPYLTGVAVPSLLSGSVMMWVYLVLGAAITTVVTLACSNVLGTWGVPASTFPFVLTSWFLMLGAYQFAHLGISSLNQPALPTDGAAQHVPLALNTLVPSLLKGVSQVFLIDSWVAGIIIVVGLAVSSLWAAGWAIIGTVGGTLFAISLGIGPEHIEKGLYGFSAVLTAIALGCTFFRPGIKTGLYALLGIVLTIFIQGALDTALAPIGIPTFTAPFVFAMWLFLFPKPNFAPTPHHRPIRDGVLTKSHSD